MRDESQPATVTIHLSATDENGKPLGGIHEKIPVSTLRAAGFPLLIQIATGAASELEEVISAHYGIPPRP